MPKFKPARIIPKRFDQFPTSGASYDLSSYSANTIAPYELALDTSNESIVVNFGGHVVEFSAQTGSGCCLPNPALNNDLLVYDGTDWVARDFMLRVQQDYGYGDYARWVALNAEFSVGSETATTSHSYTAFIAAPAVGIKGNIAYSGVFAGTGNHLGLAFDSVISNSAIIAGSSNGIVDETNSVILGGTSILISGGTSNIGAIGGTVNQSYYCSSIGVNNNMGPLLWTLNGAVNCGVWHTYLSTIDSASTSVIVASTGVTISAGTMGSAVIGCYSLTASTDFTTYVNTLDIQDVARFKPLSALPVPIVGTLFYSAGTGLMLCTGTTVADWRRL